MWKKWISAFSAVLILAMLSAGCSCVPKETSSFSNPISPVSAAVSQQSSGGLAVSSGIAPAISSSAPAVSSQPEVSSEPIASSQVENSDKPSLPQTESSSEPALSQAPVSTISSVPSQPGGPVQRVYSPGVPRPKDIIYGADVRAGEGANVDCSNLAEGFVIVEYGGSGAGGRLKVQVIKSGGSTYNYDITPGKDEVLPLTQGSGAYTINVVEGIGGTSYAVMFSCTIDVKLRDELLPYLYSNQYVDYNSAPNARAKAEELASDRSTDVEVTSAIFDYVTKTLVYDYELAKTVKSGYIPVLDNVMAVKKGICFDYASLMAGMLRYNRIPCKLVIGYAGDVYHAWIDVWLDGKGWVGGLIFYDGNGWQMMDPTFVSAYQDSTKLNSLYSKGVKYTKKYQY